MSSEFHGGIFDNCALLFFIILFLLLFWGDGFRGRTRLADVD